MMYTPVLMCESKHLELVQAIVAAIELRSRAGGKTTIQKVKAHSNVTGNENADKLATQMAEGEHTSAPIMETVSNIPYASVAWLANAPAQMNGTSSYDLNAATKGLLLPSLQAGQSNETQYVLLNRDALLLADAALSNHMWAAAGVTFLTCMYVFKLRWGLTYTGKKAFLYKRAATSACPLCQEEEGYARYTCSCPT